MFPTSLVSLNYVLKFFHICVSLFTFIKVFLGTNTLRGGPNCFECMSNICHSWLHCWHPILLEGYDWGIQIVSKGRGNSIYANIYWRRDVNIKTQPHMCLKITSQIVSLEDKIIDRGIYGVKKNNYPRHGSCVEKGKV